MRGAQGRAERRLRDALVVLHEEEVVLLLLQLALQAGSLRGLAGLGSHGAVSLAALEIDAQGLEEHEKHGGVDPVGDGAGSDADEEADAAESVLATSFVDSDLRLDKPCWRSSSRRNLASSSSDNFLSTGARSAL